MWLEICFSTSVSHLAASVVVVFVVIRQIVRLTLQCQAALLQPGSKLLVVAVETYAVLALSVGVVSLLAPSSLSAPAVLLLIQLLTQVLPLVLVLAASSVVVTAACSSTTAVVRTVGVDCNSLCGHVGCMNFHCNFSCCTYLVC